MILANTTYKTRTAEFKGNVFMWELILSLLIQLCKAIHVRFFTSRSLQQYASSLHSQKWTTAGKVELPCYISILGAL